MGRIRDAIFQLLREDHPMTNRQVFYRVESAGLIAKTEQEYKGTVCRLLAELRLAGDVAFDWIADNTRWMRKPTTHSGLQAALEHHATGYRRALWETQGAYVEVWLEKDALAGVLMEETDPWDVPLMVTRGYASLSFLHAAAATIRAAKKPTFIYYFGDYDPSGLDIDRNVERRLRQFAPDVDLTFERVGVTLAQIADWRLPTRPTKTTDSRAKASGIGRSVEVDAIPAQTLRALARRAIEQHVDGRALRVTQHYERQEREQSHLLAWLTKRHGVERVLETAAALDRPYLADGARLEGYPEPAEPGEAAPRPLDSYGFATVSEAERAMFVGRVIDVLKHLDAGYRDDDADDDDDGPRRQARILSDLLNYGGGEGSAGRSASVEAAYAAALVLRRQLEDDGDWTEEDAD